MIIGYSEKEPFAVKFTDGTHTAIADTTTEYGGAFAGFRPSDLVSAALAGCINITVRKFASSHSIPLAGVTVKVDLKSEQNTPPVFECIVEFSGDLTEEQRTRLMRAAKACPVHKILSSSPAFDLKEGKAE